MEAMHDKIEETVSQLVDPEILSNRNSPEAQALKWLIEDDTVWRHQHEDFSVERIVQRFVLVSFYLSRGGPLYWKANNWLQGEECTWNFIDCNGIGEVRALAFGKFRFCCCVRTKQKAESSKHLQRLLILRADNIGLDGQIPAAIAHLNKVENLIIKKESGVMGTIPAELGHMSSLRQLGIYYTQLQGPIPQEIFLASKLTYLNFQNNDLDGGLSSEVGQLRELETLVLMNNELTGEIPWQSLASTGVKFLGLSNNKFQGNISLLSGFSNLEFLYLDGNSLSGELPDSIGGIKTLKSLNIDNNGITGQLPTAIGLLTNLQYFSMQYNELDGPIPSQITNMAAMKTLGLGSNKLNGPLPDMQPLLQLENLYLFDNQLTGQVKNSIFELPELSTLTLVAFCGTLSVCFLLLTTFLVITELLFLSSNIFTGELPSPSGLKLNSQLIGLYMSDNQFDDEIPPSFCNLRGLQALLLDENNLSGNIPACLGMLMHLTQFHVFKNKLTGFIPQELSVLHDLGKLARSYLVVVGLPGWVGGGDEERIGCIVVLLVIYSNYLLYFVS
jgi:Leucine-rich repeat (LRR) protein